MSTGLTDAFRHDAWATRELLAVCRRLSGDQLLASAGGTYGSIIDTLRHVALAESRYCARVTGEETEADRKAVGEPGLTALTAHFEELASRWARFLETPFNEQRVCVVRWPDGTQYEVPASIHLAQTLHHGNEHRAHICTILTLIGVEAPALGVWDYAMDVGRVLPSERA